MTDLARTTVKCGAATETWTIHHLTDTHIDDADHAAKELDKRLDEIAADPRALWIGGGDYASLILPGDPRFGGSMSEQTRDAAHRLPDWYVETLVRKLRPVAGKCIGFGTGNHEQTVGKHYHRGVAAEVCSQLGIVDKYLGWRGWCGIRFNRHNREIPLWCYQYHGWSAGRLKGRKALQAERDLGAWSADAFFLGHDHQPYADTWYTEEPYGSRAGMRLRQRPRAVINGGSWTYGQRPPLEGKADLPMSRFPNESWLEGRNFRPQPPVSPTLLVHLDFGSEKRRAGFEFETRVRAPVFYVGGEAA